MATRLPEVYGKDGEDMLKILDGYVAGINAYIAEAERGEVPLPAGFADLGPRPARPVAARRRGGGRLDRARAVRRRRRLGDERRRGDGGARPRPGPKLGPQVYEDFRNRDNRDGPLHTKKRFPYQPGAGAGRLVGAPREPDRAGVGRRRPTELADAGRVVADQVRAAEALEPARRARPVAERRDVEPPRDRRAPHEERLPAPDRRAAGGLLLAADPHGLRAPLAHDRRARRGLPRAVGDRRDGPHRALRVDADRGRRGHDRHLRREALRPGGRRRRTRTRASTSSRASAEPMDRRTLREAPPGAPYPDIVVERTVHGPVLSRGTLNGSRSPSSTSAPPTARSSTPPSRSCA